MSNSRTRGIGRRSVPAFRMPDLRRLGVSDPHAVSIADKAIKSSPIPSLIMRMTWIGPPDDIPRLDTQVASQAVPSKLTRPRRTILTCRGRLRGFCLTPSTSSLVGIRIGSRLTRSAGPRPPDKRPWPSRSDSSVVPRFSSSEVLLGGYASASPFSLASGRPRSESVCEDVEVRVSCERERVGDSGAQQLGQPSWHLVSLEDGRAHFIEYELLRRVRPTHRVSIGAIVAYWVERNRGFSHRASPRDASAPSGRAKGKTFPIATCLYSHAKSQPTRYPAEAQLDSGVSCLLRDFDLERFFELASTPGYAGAFHCRSLSRHFLQQQTEPR